MRSRCSFPFVVVIFLVPSIHLSLVCALCMTVTSSEPPRYLSREFDEDEDEDDDDDFGPSTSAYRKANKAPYSVSQFSFPPR